MVRLINLGLVNFKRLVMFSLTGLVFGFKALISPSFKPRQIVAGLSLNFLGLMLAAVGLWSCESKKNDPEPEPLAVESKTMKNLHAPQKQDRSVNPPVFSGDFVKFDFSTGKITTSDTDWDIAFRGTTILVNGGASSGIAEEPKRTGKGAAYIAKATFADVTSVNEADLKQDAKAGLAIPTGSGNGWYNYNAAQRIINPIPGRVLVFKTADGRYAKVEILSYYKDAPSNLTSDIIMNGSQYYTFNYVYQPNGGSTSFK